ncbi:unnamed protein product, partial [Brassica rapa]
LNLKSCSRTFDSSKAKDLLGYAPVVPLQGTYWFNVYHCFPFVLIFNDTVQWKKQTLIAIVILITLYINFVATTGYSAIPIANLLALIIFFLRFFGNKKSD